MNTITQAIIAAVIFGAGWMVNGWRLNGDIEALQGDHATAIAAALAATRVAEEKLNKERDEWNASRATVDQQQTESLRLANEETKRLRDCIANGTCGLRVAARCPAPGAHVPQAGTPGSVDHGARAELDADARRTYFALREGIDRVTRQLTACQQSQ